MSTHALVGIKNNSGIYYTYVHFDGYVKDGLGEMLFRCYNNMDKATQLVSEYTYISGFFTDGRIASGHNDPSTQRCVTDVKEFISLCDDYWAYGYIWDTDNNQWFYYDRTNLSLLSEVVKSVKL